MTLSDNQRCPHIKGDGNAQSVCVGLLHDKSNDGASAKDGNGAHAY